MGKYKKIIPVMIIVAIIIGIWFYKNGPQTNEESVDRDPKFALDVTYKFNMEELKSYGLPIIINFGSESCPACKEIAPVLKEINKAYEGKVTVKYVDVWKDEKAAQDFPLKVIPTQFFFYADGTPWVPKDNQGEFTTYSKKGSKKPVYTAHEGVLTRKDFDKIIKELEAK